MTDQDMIGKPFRTPGKTGRPGRGRRTKEERQEASRDNKANHWAGRLDGTESPIQALRVMADRATTAALQAERRAGTEVKRAQRTGDAKKIADAEKRLTTLQTTIDDEINKILDQLADFVEAHQPVRV